MDELHWYLKEDLGEIGDITSDALFTNETASAEIITKEKCVLAGLEEAKQLLCERKCDITALAADGDILEKDFVILQVAGKAITILMLERLLLNILGRMSGIATETNRLVSMCKKINQNVSIAATRKTTPGFRKFEKKAVKIGGGDPHRYGLYDAIMIKDNHLTLAGSIETAIATIRKKHPKKPIEIEVETYDDAILAAKLQAEVIMLDNFSSKNAQKTTEDIRAINPNIIIECSGGITSDNITEFALFADRISLGCLTHTVRNIDFTMQFL